MLTRRLSLGGSCAVDMPEHISDIFVERIKQVVVLLLISSSSRQSPARLRRLPSDAGIVGTRGTYWSRGGPTRSLSARILLRIAPQLVRQTGAHFGLDDV